MDILYLRATPKLSNKNTNVMKMECPYLSVAPNGKICRLMVERGLDGELDDFDRTHYCNGNPNHCYFYRSCSVQKPANEQLEENKPEKIQVGFFDELSKLDVGESKTFINNHEPRPFYSELTKRGFRYRVKQESEDKWVITVTKESDRITIDERGKREIE